MLSTRRNEIHYARAISEYIIFMSMSSEDEISEAKFLVPDWGGGYSRLQHKIVVPAGQPM
jgi:hypothetical protein